MKDKFEAVEHCGRMSKKLIEAFSDDDHGTTPTAVGEAKEADARKLLAEVLPAGMGVGTGFVVDVCGNTSKQQDIIIYEKDLCPRFRISDSTDTAYYPCEGVIATGEVKSTLTAQKIEEAFNNIASVKQLRRSTEESNVRGKFGTYSVRKYGNSIAILDPTQFDQQLNSSHQIYSFILAGNVRGQTKTFAKWCQNQVLKGNEEFYPNLIVVGDTIIAQPATCDIYEDQNGRQSPTNIKHGLAFQDVHAYYVSDFSDIETRGYKIVPHPMQLLLHYLCLIWDVGITVPVETMRRYYTYNGDGFIGHEGYLVRSTHHQQ